MSTDRNRLPKLKSEFAIIDCRQQASSSIFFHLHGGGFVSQTSKSHETYLKQWATEWDMPVLSIDYSLAPEAPYPRALEEVVFAYAWYVL